MVNPETSNLEKFNTFSIDDKHLNCQILGFRSLSLEFVMKQ